MVHRLVKIPISLASMLLVMSLARGAEIEWAKRMGGLGNDGMAGMSIDGQGMIYAAGMYFGTSTFGPFTLTANNSAGSMFVEKLDPLGTVVWAKRLGGTNSQELRSMVTGPNGHTYVTGFFSGDAIFGPYTVHCVDRADVFVAELDPDGTVEWAKSMGGVNEEDAFSIAVDRSGNSYVTGYFNGSAQFGAYTLTSAGQWDMFVEKLDSGGTVLWARRMGGQGYDFSDAIAVDSAGNAYVTGWYAGPAEFGSYALPNADSGPFDQIFVEKLGPDGTVRWVKSMGGNGNDSGVSITVDTFGNDYVTGYFTGTIQIGPYSLSSAGSFDFYVAKLDPAGSVIWAKSMGGAGSDGTGAIGVDPTGNSYVIGSFERTAMFGPYALVSAGTADVFVEKIDPAGDVVWAKGLGGLNSDVGASLALSPGGAVYISGVFAGAVNFDSYPLSSAGGYDVFVAKLRECGAGFLEDHGYAPLVFPPLCTRSASPLVQDEYNSASLGVFRGLHDRFFLSSGGHEFSALTADDAVHVDGVDSGLGPYASQPGKPPYGYDVPIEQNLVPQPARDVTPLIPSGESGVLFELLDTDRQIYGNTAVYLVRDCGIWLDMQAGQARLHWVSQQVAVGGAQSNLDVVSGRIRELRADGSFSRACYLGTYTNRTQVVDTRPSPPPGDGDYYLVSGTCASPIGYGNSVQGFPPASTPRAGLPGPGTPCP